MTRQHLSRFSPSKMTAETLDRIFVQRHRLLDHILDCLRESARTESRHHILVVGPRGVGKTHLISMVFHKVEAMAREEPSLRIAWLLEDETSTSLLDLLVRIWDALMAKYPAEFSPAVLDAARKRTRPDARKYLEQALIDRLQDKTLVVLIENLDDVFKNLDRPGQHDLRAFLQESRTLCLVATSQRLSADVVSRESPFFGFFHIEHLMPLDESDAVELLARVAALHGEEDLVSFLNTRDGRKRVKVVLHLAGGNHRVFIILAEFLNRRSLDELVPPFERLLDELTPYYQARIAWLSPQQRQIAEFLCRSRQPMPVKEIATTLFLTHQGASAQLKELRSLGYVISAQRGREVLYELAEPLMRLCWEVKESRGEPIRLIVDFLRAWFDRDERQALLLGYQEETQPFRAYLEQSLLEPQFLAGYVAEVGMARKYLASAQPEPNQDVPSTEQEPVKGLAAGLELPGGQYDDLIANSTRIIELPSTPPDQAAKTLIIRGVRLFKEGRIEEAVVDSTRAIELAVAPADVVARALFLRGLCHGRAGRAEEAAGDYTRAIELAGAPADVVAQALFLRGVCHAQAGGAETAAGDYTRAIELAGAPAELVARALVLRGLCHGEAGRAEEAAGDYTRAIELAGAPADVVARALFLRGVCHAQAGGTETAAGDYTRAIELAGAPADVVARALFLRGLCHGEAGRGEEAVGDYTRAIELPDAPAESLASAWTGLGWQYLLAGDASRAQEAIQRSLSIIPDRDVAVLNATLAKVVVGDWAGGLRDYADALKRFPELASTNVDAPAFLWYRLLESDRSVPVWNERVGTLVAMYAPERLSTLGSGLVRSLKHVRPGRLTEEIVQDWLNLLSAQARMHEALVVPLRLYQVGLRYLVRSDPGILLDLPSEERRVLTDLFDLPDPTRRAQDRGTVRKARSGD